MKKKCLKRLKYTKELKKLNKEIEKNLYNVVNLELLDDNNKINNDKLKLWNVKE